MLEKRKHTQFEIIGIAGIDGNGQTELVQAITGLRKVKSGDITIKGESIIHKTTRQITEMSVEIGRAHV